MGRLLQSMHVFPQLTVRISHNSITVGFQHNPPFCAEATSGWWCGVVWCGGGSSMPVLCLCCHKYNTRRKMKCGLQQSRFGWYLGQIICATSTKFGIHIYLDPLFQKTKLATKNTKWRPFAKVTSIHSKIFTFYLPQSTVENQGHQEITIIIKNIYIYKYN